MTVEKRNKKKNISLEPLPVAKSLFLTLIDKNPQSSGYDLMQQVMELTDNHLNIQSGSIYPTLRELEKGGLLSSNQQTTGRKRRLYTITAQGKSELVNMGRFMRFRWEIVLLPLLDLIEHK